jgi:hypothetical protein
MFLLVSLISLKKEIAFVTAVILTFFQVLLVSEYLSFIHSFTKEHITYYYIASSVIFFIILIFYGSKYYCINYKFFKLNILKIEYRTIRNRFPKILILLIFLFKFFEGLLIAPNLYDAMTYSLPRILHWFGNNDLNFYETSIMRQNETPYLPSLFIAHIFALTGSDTLFFLIPFFCAIYSFYLVNMVSKVILRSDKSVYVVLLVLSSPTGLSQISNLQFDWVTVCLVLSLLSFIMFSVSFSLRTFDYLIIGILTALLLVTKMGAIYAPIPILALFILNRKKLDAKKIINFLIPLFSVLPFFQRLLFSKSPSEARLVFNAAMDFKLFLTNFLRQYTSMIQSQSDTINKFIESGVLNSFKFFNIDTNPNEITWPYAQGYSLSMSTHGDVVGSPYISILFLLVIFGVLKRIYTKGLEYKFNYLYVLGIITVLQSIIFSLLIRWQPWGNRLLLTNIVFITLFFSTIIAKHYSIMFLRILSFSFVILSSFWVLHNPTRSLFESNYLCSVSSIMCEGNSYKKERAEEYFLNNPVIFTEYQDVSTIINSKTPQYVEIVQGVNDYEFPLWVLTKFKVSFVHSSQKIVVCTTECFFNKTDYSALYLGEHVQLFEKMN